MELKDILFAKALFSAESNNNYGFNIFSVRETIGDPIYVEGLSFIKVSDECIPSNLKYGAFVYWIGDVFGAINLVIADLNNRPEGFNAMQMDGLFVIFDAETTEAHLISAATAEIAGANGLPSPGVYINEILSHAQWALLYEIGSEDEA